MKYIYACLAFCALGTCLQATPLIIVEPPDFPDTAGPEYILDLGVNTISGSVNGCDGCGNDDLDNFSLTLPIGMIITNGSLAITTFSDGGGTDPVGACFTGAGCFFTGGFSGLSSFTGTQAFTMSSPYSSLGGGIGVGYVEYTVSFTVDADPNAVPEPSTFALGGSVLLGLAAWKRRRG